MPTETCFAATTCVDSRLPIFATSVISPALIPVTTPFEETDATEFETVLLFAKITVLPSSERIPHVTADKEYLFGKASAV